MSRSASSSEPSVWIAKETFFGEGGLIVHKGDRVASGHELLRVHAGYFEPANENVRFGVVEATASPGEQRDAPKPAKPEPKPEPKAEAKPDPTKVPSRPKE